MNSDERTAFLMSMSVSTGVDFEDVMKTVNALNAHGFTVAKTAYETQTVLTMEPRLVIVEEL